ncbi:Ig-like domain-containing protein [Stenotrophomonas sp. SY1]|uniref:Ig-like domain-containing protein n=1 Tax=Stenotrophomonas sp. SY1 TaxID=477235 RepID=UPI001E612F3F|nr:Ig-like domain-containing protein [Stenotrophomonas sp. SY1]MCD9087349.1 Ig-like domain-containing protein [Stenotrophomonas sp. SY1]
MGMGVFGAGRQWLGVLMKSTAAVRTAVFLFLALAMPAAHAASCSITWNVTNDGRTGHYAYPLSVADSAACLEGDRPYTDGARGIVNQPAEGGGVKGVDWLTPSNTLFYTPASPAFIGTNSVIWYDVSGQPIVVTINMTAAAAVPTVTSVAPNSGPSAGGTSVTITGTGFTGATAVRFGATNAGSVIVNSATSITATSPAGSGIVDITVTTLNGTSVTSAADRFTYIAPGPIVTSVSPNAGPSSGGTSVTIGGANLSDATSVKFGTEIGTITANSATSITATSPPGSGTVNVTVATAGGTGTLTGAFTYVVPVPTVTSVAPNSGPPAGGTSVTIGGTGFTGALAVRFGAVNAIAVVVNSDTSITAISPAGLGTVDITVTTPSGTSANSPADLFTYVVPAPAVLGVSPGSGPTTGGTPITLSGSNFIGATAVRFGATSASFTVNGANVITATSPAGTPGTVDITVTTAGGTSATNASDQFTYIAVPVVSGVSPNTGSTDGGTNVTITGTDFAGATSVKFGGAFASSFTVNSASSITATSPAHSAGTVDVTVTTAGGTSEISAADRFTYVNAKVPPVAGGAAVTVAYGSSSNRVTLNLTGGAATSVAVATQALRGTATAVGTTITYTPAASFAGADSFTYTATNADGTSSPATVNVTVSSPTISYAPTSPAPGIAGLPYSHSVAGASGGAGPYTYSLLSGTLPAGMSLASNGILSGMSTDVGSFNFTVRAQDSSVGTGPFHQDSGTLTLVITPPTLALSPATGSAFNGSVGTGFSQRFSLSGGVAPYQFAPLSVTVGTMPSGLGFDTATGTLSGTPTSAGTVAFMIAASDSNGSTSVVQSYTLTVAAPTLSLSPGTLPNAVQGTTYNQTLSTTGGSAPYTYAITSGAAPTGLVLSLGGVLIGTPTVTGSFTFAITATDAHGFTAGRSYNVVTNPAAPVAGPISATVPWNTATPIDLGMAISGGPASSVAISGGAAHGSVSVSGLVVTYTPVPGYSGSDSFVYTATNVSGASAAVVSLTVNPQTPVAGAKSVTAAFNTATPIDLASVISGGVPGSLAVSTQPAHGATTVSGTTITYTPAAGYSGTDSFDYTATNAGGTSAPATVSLTVTPQAPVAGGKSATVAFNVATPIDLASVITGGAPSSLVVSTQPAHGAVTVAGTTITYTPTAGYSGTDSFDYVAINAGGTSAPATVSLTINPQVPVAAARSVMVAFNIATPIDLASSITGGAPESLAVSTQPAHGTVAISGTTITYTPAADYSGTDSFSYTATNAGGTSAAAVVSLTINPQVPVANNATTTLTTGADSSFIVELDIGGGAATGVTIVTPPAHGTVTVNAPAAMARSRGIQAAAAVAATGFSVTYVPNANYIGPDSFAYTASNAGGTSAPATVRLQVTAPAPTVTPLNVTTVSGAPITIDVAARASGGPFTAVAIVAQPAEGKAVTQGLTVVYTPTPTFVGTETIVYSLSNAYGTTQGTVTVTVNARLDASKDPEVTGLVAAQAEAARRFATAQLSNFNRRLERLHGNGWAGSDSNLNLSANGLGLTLKPGGVVPSGQSKSRRDSDRDDDTAQQLLAANEAGEATALSSPTNAAASNGQPSRFGYWIDGRIDLGQRDAMTNQSELRFQTDGISLGADYRLNDWASLGAGAGYARDDSDVGRNGSRSTGTARIMALYGSLRPADKWFVDGVLGYGALDFDLKRHVTDTAGFAAGSRDGKQTFGSLTTGYENRQDTWMLSPYGRLDLMKTRLDAYTESASGVSALHYNKQTVRMTTGALGMRGEMLFKTHLGNLIPRARFEYRHSFEGADMARMSYADLIGVGQVYEVSPTQAERNQFIFGFGTAWILRSRMALSLDYEGTLNNESGYNQAINARVDMPF